MRYDNIMTTSEEKVDKIKIEKDSEKYKVTLKLLNKILVNIGKEEIDDITKFKDIDREDIIKDVNVKALCEMEKELFTEHYSKKKCGYYRKTNAMVLNCIRSMMKDAGFEFTKKKKEKNEKINGKSYKRSHFLYSIK